MAFDLDQRIQQEAQRQADENGEGGAAAGGSDNAGVDDDNAGQQQQAGADAGAAGGTQGTVANTGNDNDQNGQQQQSSAAVNNNPDLFVTKLEMLSGGKIKTEADLISVFEKANQFDTVKPEYDTLKAKPVFADEFEQKRSELKLAGASKEALKTFERLHDLGDLTQLDPLEAKVMKMVLVDGYSEKLARAELSKEFPIDTTYDDDKELLLEKLGISAKADLKALQDYQVEITSPAADNRLAQTVNVEQLKSDLKPVFEDFTKQFNSLKTVTFNDGDGKQAVTMDLAVDADSKAAMTADIQEFLIGNNLPLTQENYNEAMAYARNNHIAKNLDTMLKDTWKKADEHFTKFYTEKYENLSGLPRQDRRAIETLSADEEKAFKGALGVDLSKQ